MRSNKVVIYSPIWVVAFCYVFFLQLRLTETDRALSVFFRTNSFLKDEGRCPPLVANEQEATIPEKVENGTPIATTNKVVDAVPLLIALSGNETANFEEWMVALKSILMNAPAHAPLHIHVLADGPAITVLQSETASW